jgi:hypothetical protein
METNTFIILLLVICICLCLKALSIFASILWDHYCEESGKQVLKMVDEVLTNK